MVYKIKTYTNIWLQGYEVTIESDMNKSLPTIEIIGLADTAIKEAKERIRATFRNVGISLPNKKIILNLAPSNTKKIGTRFDVPMAVAILLLLHPEATIPAYLPQALFFGELGLDGKVKKVEGLLPCAIAAQKNGHKHFFIPYTNSYELSYLQGITIYPIKHFKDIIKHLLENIPITPATQKNPSHSSKSSKTKNKTTNQTELRHIQWQVLAKRAATIAAAGRHNILFIGSPWCGKTMMSKAIQNLLPPPTFEESLQISQIYSIIGKLNKDNPIITQRPFRQVHHTASQIAIVGGGKNLFPWEISLAHKGILFLDEITEFPREVLEVLRQPLEEKTITISRAAGSSTYPADFMLVASMNPCKCWYYKDTHKPCNCSINSIQKYQSKLSGPLLDRIDIILELPREKHEIMLNPISKTTATTNNQDKILQARETQKRRFKDTQLTANAQIPGQDIHSYIHLSSQTKNFLQNAAQKLNLSIRTIHRTIKVARTIADIEWEENIEIHHLSEAIQYRSQNILVDHSW